MDALGKKYFCEKMFFFSLKLFLGTDGLRGKVIDKSGFFVKIVFREENWSF